MTKILYFAYGSNMLTRRLRAPGRVPSAVAVSTGYVAGRKLTFDKVSTDGSGKCDLEATADQDARVHGVLFEIDASEKPSLDRAEGLGQGYDEANVKVVTESGPRDALAYIATSKDPTIMPYRWYQSLVIAGAAEHDLPEPYIQGLFTVRSKQDPDSGQATENHSLAVAGTVDAALARAIRQEDNGRSPGEVHRNRSRNFVDALGALIRRQYRESSGVLVFSKHYDRNRDRFGLNELLYDILVCETGITPSAYRLRPLTYVKRAIWAIESEFGHSGDALRDFNKLVVSNAKTKLFIGSISRDPVAFLRPLAAAAHHCVGEVFVALVPHPDKWQPGVTIRARMWRWRQTDWREVAA